MTKHENYVSQGYVEKFVNTVLDLFLFSLCLVTISMNFFSLYLSCHLDRSLNVEIGVEY